MDPLLRKELGSAPWTNNISAKRPSSSKLFYWLTKKSDPFNCRLAEGATCCYFPSFNRIVRDDFLSWGQDHS